MANRLRTALASLTLATIPVAGRAACPADVDAFAATVDAAAASFAAMDVDSFTGARERADEAVTCLEAPLTPADAAAYHRMVGMGEFLDRDQDRALDAFRAALAIQPAFELPGSVAPEGHPLRALYEEAATSEPGEPVAALVPRGAILLVDGQRSTTRPADRDAVLQLLGPDGAVLWSGVVAGDAELPDWPYEPPPEEQFPAEPMPQPRKVSVPLLIGAGVAVAAAGGLYAGALDSRAKYDDLATPFPDLDSLRARTNGLTTASQVSVVVAVGLGVGAFTLGPR